MVFAADELAPTVIKSAFADVAANLFAKLIIFGIAVPFAIAPFPIYNVFVIYFHINGQMEKCAVANITTTNEKGML